jgi:hypothetical protein
MKKIMGKKSLLVLMVFVLTFVFVLPAMAVPPGSWPKSITGGGYIETTPPIIDPVNFGFNLMIQEDNTLAVNFQAVSKEDCAVIKIKANDKANWWIVNWWTEENNDIASIEFEVPAQIKINNDKWQPTVVHVMATDDDINGDKITIDVQGMGTIVSDYLDGGNIQAHYAKLKP